MEIRSKFRFNALFLLIMILLIGSIQLFAIQRLNETLAKQHVADKIVNYITDLNQITIDYLMTPSDRAWKQWVGIHRRLTELLKVETFETPTELQVLRKLQRNHGNLQIIFFMFVEVFKKSNTDGQVESLEKELLERLSNQLMFKSQDIISSTHQLTDLVKIELKKVQTQNSIIIFSTVVIISILMFLNSILIARSITKPIFAIHNGIRIIGEGDLKHQIVIRGGDEIGELGKAFNQMAESLDAITVSREKLAREIEERKQAEDKLNDSERSLATLMSNLPGMAYRCKNNKNWTMEFVSNGSYELTGYHPTDLINNKKIAYGELIHTEDREQVWETVQSALNKKESFQSIYRISNIAGEEKWVWEKGRGVFSPDGEVQALEGFISDITDRKQVEAELEKHRVHLEELVEKRTYELIEKTDKIEESRKALTYLVEDVNEAGEELEKVNIKLKELDRLKSMFIASMSHELRTPLNSIIGFTGIILQGLTGEINAEQKDQLQRVNGSAKHLLNLITDIIDISKIEAGKVGVYPEEVNLNGVIKEAVSSLKPEIDNKGIGLEISLPPDLQLITDKKRLFQCLLNFLSNAVKFTEKGKIKITALEVGGMMEIRVKDTGIGIKEEDMPRLFKSFVRLDTPLKTVIPGTGLGLYLTKKLAIEVLKGSVSVESTYGEGSVFVLEIPREI